MDSPRGKHVEISFHFNGRDAKINFAKEIESFSSSDSRPGTKEISEKTGEAITSWSSDSGNIEFEEDNRNRFPIIAMTEGIHNMFEISAEELKLMVSRADLTKAEEKRSFYKVPIILDHSHEFLKKVGATVFLEFDKEVKARNGKILQGVKAVVELWDDTPMQREVLARVKRDLENTYFSISARGVLEETETEGAWAKIVDMVLIHIAIVNEPADENAAVDCSADVTVIEEEYENSENAVSDEDAELPKETQPQPQTEEVSAALDTSEMTPDVTPEQPTETDTANSHSTKYQQQQGESITAAHTSMQHDSSAAPTDFNEKITTSDYALADNTDQNQYIGDQDSGITKEFNENKEKSDFHLSDQGDTGVSMDSTDLQANKVDATMQKFEQMSADLVNVTKERDEALARADAAEASVAEFKEKLPLVGEVKALDASIDDATLVGFSKEQLVVMRDALARAQVKEETTEKGIDFGTAPQPQTETKQEMSAADKATMYFGELGED